MYAIVKTGGKQYRLEPGSFVRVELLTGDVGDKVHFDEVLLVADGNNLKIGTPTLADAKVLGEITEQGKAKKVITFKKRRRKGYRNRCGHRQKYTEVKITEIVTA